MSNEINITKKTIILKECEICGLSEILTLENNGIIKRKEKYYQNYEFKHKFLSGTMSRKTYRTFNVFYSKCSNCGKERYLGDTPTSKYTTTEWV